jgi:two-component system, OmpR family, sensor histidine kinase KdpD
VEQRRNPEMLLRQAQESERQEKRGKLKIYLGAAPGVGKTHTMLEDAIARRLEGLDVVVGIVESHKRIEIETLLKKLDVLPCNKLKYKDKELDEFAIDHALKRNPGLILVDEMAHTNVPGSRHAKRWQDIKELLDRGIDVYTTLNVQHIESLNDIVSSITHIRIQETVPDFMLELADTLELVDLPPEELLKRLKEGKIYIPQQAELAKEHFFRKGNLIALRELALRITAERVSTQVLLYRQDLGIKHIWPTKEKILVCVGHKMESTKLIRSAKRMAVNLQADWMAVHVDIPRLKLSDEARNNAIQNLRLAEMLGAGTRILTGFDVVKEIMNFARQQNVTQIVVGKMIRPRWKELFFKSLADEMVRQSKEIDVYIITSNVPPVNVPTLTSTPRKISLKTYGISLAIVALSTIIDFLLSPLLKASNLIMVYLLGITFVALFGQMGPSLLACILSVLAYDFFFVSPFFSFSIGDLQSFFTLIVMLLVAQIISHLTILTRRQAEAASISEQKTIALHTLSRQLASSRGVDKLLDVGMKYISELFDSEVLALLSENNHLVVRARCKSEQVMNEKELGIAQWVFDLGEMAGLGTNTLPYSDALFVPLLTSQGSIGVLRVHPVKKTSLVAPEQKRLLEACANQIAVALEVDRLDEQTKKSEMLSVIDRARHALLQSVSHDLRTPLIASLGLANTLSERASELDVHTIKELGNSISIELEQLNRLINNLLEITYLEAESVTLQKLPHALGDTIHLVIDLLKTKLKDKPLLLTLPPTLNKVLYDDRLIQEVLINLIDNAIKFTSHESPIEISVELRGKDKVMVSVQDRGPGIMQDEVKQLFEKFYRGRKLRTERGLGLGLALCRLIIKAHGGDIWVENRPDGGAAFRFTLPLTQD